METKEEKKSSEEELEVSFNLKETFSKIKQTLEIMKNKQRLIVFGFLLLTILLQFFPNKNFLPWGGIWARMESKDLPLADLWAENSVFGAIKSGLRGEVAQKYPHLPEAQREKVVEENFNKLLKEQSSFIEQQKQFLASRIRDSYQYEENGEKWFYLADIDPYFFLRFARNILEKGRAGDEVKDGKQWDNHINAPLGGFIGKSAISHARTLLLILKVAKLFKPSIPLMEAAKYFPVVFILLSFIPVFLIGRRLGGTIGGFFSATLLGLLPGIAGRTVFGLADTDAYNVFFPLLIVWLFIESFYSRTKIAKLIFATLGGVSAGVYSLYWQWWFMFDILLASAFAALVVTTFVSMKRKELAWKDVLKIVSATAVFSIAGVVTVAALGENPLNAVFEAIRGPIAFKDIKDASKPNLWPNVYTTVAELNPGDVKSIVESVGGKVILMVAALGILLAFTRGINGLLVAMVITVWFAATFYASLKGIRFTLLLGPAVAVAYGGSAGIVTSVVSRWAEKQLSLKKYFFIPLFFFLFSLLLVWPSNVVGTAAGIARNNVPIINDAWWEALTAIKENSKPNAIITSWWDFGHHFKYIADRPVTFDGGSQNSPIAHWVGKLLLSPNENLSVGILRMLNCGSNLAFEALFNQTNNTPSANKILNEILELDRKQAEEKLLNHKINPEPVLKYTHCDPPESFLITSEDMIFKAGVWGHFGSWDFIRADMWLNLKKLPKEKGVEYVLKNYAVYNLSKETAEQLWNEARSITSEDEANRWIASWPGFMNRGDCDIQNQSVVCTNGLVIENGTPYIQVQQGKAPLDALSSIDKNRSFSLQKFEGRAGVGAILVPTRDRYYSWLAAPEQAGSLFSRLHFFEGHGLRHFELLKQTRHLDGGKVMVWKVLWEPREEPLMLEAVRPREQIEYGAIVKLDYIGWLEENGSLKIFDSTIYDWQNKNITPETDLLSEVTKPLIFEMKPGAMIPGFEKVLIGMKKGEEKTVTIPPEEGYGTDPEKHPLGNKTLHFKIRVKSIE